MYIKGACAPTEFLAFEKNQLLTAVEGLVISISSEEHERGWESGRPIVARTLPGNDTEVEVASRLFDFAKPKSDHISPDQL